MEEVVGGASVKLMAVLVDPEVAVLGVVLMVWVVLEPPGRDIMEGTIKILCLIFPVAVGGGHRL
jgi:hypothetical protein